MEQIQHSKAELGHFRGIWNTNMLSKTIREKTFWTDMFSIISKLIDLTNNIRLLEFEPPHFASEKYLEAFKTIELGELYASIPWTALVRDVGRRLGIKNKGPKPYFDLHAKLALMILKPYFSCSDNQLMERLNTDWSVQFFCNVYIRIEDELPNYKVISKIR